MAKRRTNKEKRIMDGKLIASPIPYKADDGLGCGWAIAVLRGHQVIGVVHDSHYCGEVIWTTYAESEVRMAYPGMTRHVAVDLRQETIVLILACMERLSEQRNTHVLHQDKNNKWLILPDPGKMGKKPSPITR